MRIAIVDDLAEERELLKTRLEKQLQRRNVQADLLEYAGGEDFLEAVKAEPFTVVFLDIYMTGMNGIETAKQLRRLDTRCLLVFTTTSTDHALEGFQVRALHYLVKPFTEEELDSLTDELLSRIPRPDKYMELKVDGTGIRLCYKNIVYAEHFAHMIYIHTTAGKRLPHVCPSDPLLNRSRQSHAFLYADVAVSSIWSTLPILKMLPFSWMTETACLSARSC